MEVLHALWEHRPPGALLIWAESSGLVGSMPRRRGRPPRVPKPRPHPFALPHRSLMEVLGGLPGGPFEGDAEPRVLTVHLPSSTRSGPAPSPELILEEHPDEGPERLMPWLVETASLGTSECTNLLISLPTTAPPGVSFGASLRFWSEVARLSLELVATRCFAPMVREVEANGSTLYEASWDATVSESTGKRLDLLARAMPPACYAAVLHDGGDPPLPRDPVVDLLDRTVDRLVRDSISLKGLLPPRRGRPPKRVDLAEQWIGALSEERTYLSGSPGELRDFTREVQSWLGQTGDAGPDAQLRTCFRLDPPAEGSEGPDGWYLGYHLQARDDPSLLVEVDRVWRGSPETRTFLDRRFEDPHERLLADLGRASRLYPRIEESLETAHPAGMWLDAEGAYAFMRQHAPLLDQAGFGVLLPAWWREPKARLGVRLQVRPGGEAIIGSGLLGMEGLVAYDWVVAIGDETLSTEEFEEIARMKVPLVRVRGRWVELRPEEMEKAIAYFKGRVRGGEMALGDALRMGLGLERSEVGLEVTGVEGEGWVGDLLGRLRGNTRLPTVRTPRALKGVLRPYQRRGLSWLAFLDRFGLGACLADDMGLGKTIQIMALLLHERTGRKRESPLAPTLIISPMSVVGNWCRELERFAPSLHVMVHHGLSRLSGDAFVKAVSGVDIVLSTYSLANRDEEVLAQVEWHRIVLDEAQNIKNRAAKQTRAIKRLPADRRVAMTGTPVENRLAELWSIMDFLNPGHLGRPKVFRKVFAIPIERYHDQDRAEVLKQLIQPFVLRRMKTDRTIIKDLPEKVEMVTYCNLSREQGTLYEAALEEMMDRIDDSEGIERKGLVLATLMKLKQICNHPAQFLHDGSGLPDRSGKLERLEEMLDEALAEGDRALIFTQFREMGGMLRSHLTERFGREVLFLHGGTPKGQRDSMVQRFQDPGGGPHLFILSLKAGGLGLNLTAAHRVFHFDRWWNPAVEDQATDRAYRIGQEGDVIVHKLVCIGTLEERIDQMIERKKELADTVIGSGEGWITEMSTQRLRELFALSREAMGGV